MPAGGVKVRMVKASCRFVGAATCRAHVLAKESLHEYPVDEVDRAGITAFRGMMSLQPARQLILVLDEADANRCLGVRVFDGWRYGASEVTPMTADEHVREVYAYFGLAVYCGQLLEHGIVN